MNNPSRQNWLDRADFVGRWLESFFLVSLFTLLLGLSTLQIVLRNGFSMGLVWADELVRLSVLWLAVVGAVAASRDRKHIAIELLARALPPVSRLAVVVAVDIFASIVSGIFALQSWRFVVDSREFGDLLLGNWPAWTLQLILPVGFALIAYRYLVHAASVLLRNR